MQEEISIYSAAKPGEFKDILKEESFPGFQESPFERRNFTFTPSSTPTTGPTSSGTQEIDSSQDAEKPGIVTLDKPVENDKTSLEGGLEQPNSDELKIDSKLETKN